MSLVGRRTHLAGERTAPWWTRALLAPLTPGLLPLFRLTTYIGGPALFVLYICALLVDLGPVAWVAVILFYLGCLLQYGFSCRERLAGFALAHPGRDRAAFAGHMLWLVLLAGFLIAATIYGFKPDDWGLLLVRSVGLGALAILPSLALLFVVNALWRVGLMWWVRRSGT